MIPELSIIIEYIDQHYPGRIRLIPADPDRARETRLRDRFYDLHVHVPMQRIVGDRIRPADKKDPFGVEQARAQLGVALDMVEATWPKRRGRQRPGPWATLSPWRTAPRHRRSTTPISSCRSATTHKNATAYLARLTERPSFARTLREAEPYRHLFPT